MAKVVLKTAGQPVFIQGIAGGNTAYHPITSGSELIGTSVATESTRTTTFRTGGVLSNLSINIITNSGTDNATASIRKGTADGNMNITITASTTGWFEDTTNTDTVTAGDDWHCRVTQGAAGGSLNYNVIQTLFAATTNTVSRYGQFTATTFSSSTTQYAPLSGSRLGGTEANAQLTVKSSGTRKNLFVYITANTRTSTTTFASRLNGADGNISIAVPTGTTGAFEDTSNTDSIVATDLIDTRVTTATGSGSITFIHIASDIETTDDSFYLVSSMAVGASFSQDTTRYLQSAGTIIATTIEADTQHNFGLSATLSKLQVYVNSNTVAGTTTVTTRVGGADGNQTISIGSTATGEFTDATNSDSVVTTSLVNYKVAVPATSGGQAINIRKIAMSGVTVGSTAIRDIIMMGFIPFAR